VQGPEFNLITKKKKKKWREQEEKSDKLYCKLRVEFERFLN
jgi:hypothetical protein